VDNQYLYTDNLLSLEAREGPAPSTSVVLAIKHFSAYLMARHFLIQTDHRALQWLNNFKEKNARLTRWSLLLQPFNFIVEHRKGQQNAKADALSRLHYVPEKEGGNVKDSILT
jgi:hypothetical protein